MASGACSAAEYQQMMAEKVAATQTQPWTMLRPRTWWRFSTILGAAKTLSQLPE